MSEAKKVFMMFGLNDLAVRNWDDVLGYFSKIIDNILETNPDVEIIVQGVLPVQKSFYGTVVITTPYDAYRAARLIIQSVPVERILPKTETVSFHLSDYVDDVREQTLKSRFRSYPILDENDQVVGTLSRYHLLRPNRKQVVLVDHNEVSQSVDGLSEAEILAIIDGNCGCSLHRTDDPGTAGNGIPGTS